MQPSGTRYEYKHKNNHFSGILLEYRIMVDSEKVKFKLNGLKRQLMKLKFHF